MNSWEDLVRFVGGEEAEEAQQEQVGHFDIQNRYTKMDL